MLKAITKVKLYHFKLLIFLHKTRQLNKIIQFQYHSKDETDIHILTVK